MSAFGNAESGVPTGRRRRSKVWVLGTDRGRDPHSTPASVWLVAHTF